MLDEKRPPPVFLPVPRRVEWTGRPVVRSRCREIVDPNAVPRREGYRLAVDPEETLLVAHDVAGAAHGRRTLAQLLRQAGPDGLVPGVRIEDWPDFPDRGVMLDVSRDKVPTMATLLAVVDLLADLKINQLQLYVEHTFAYRAHPAVWAGASPLTGEEIRALDAYCRERFVELVPNQNSFGHMERWLKHPRYADLAEMPYRGEPEGAEGDPGYRSLCAVDPRSISLIAGLYDELLPHFTSGRFNVGCDETLDIGKGRSREACEARGTGRVYLDFLLAIHAEVRRHGRAMMFWGDIVLRHPELISELPEDVIALNWGYEADHPFDLEGARFADAGVRHYVCPGTSSWLSIAGRTANAVANIRAATEAGLRHGAVGCLTTDWGDLGHWQPLSVSWAGIACGAAMSWCVESNRDIDLPRALDTHVFRDRASVMGRLATDLGNAHLETGVAPKNATAPGLLLLFPERSLTRGSLAGLTADGLVRFAERVRAILDPISGARMDRPDAAVVADEMRLSASLLTHAASLGTARLAAPGHDVRAAPSASRRALDRDLRTILPEFRRIWLERNRPGGLDDSASRIEGLLQRYEGRRQSS